MKIHAYLLFLFCFLSSPLTAQTGLTTLKHLGTENGLSNNYVQAITQDKQGCIWVATELGLNRFDGYSFTTYKSNNSPLTSDALNALYYDESEDMLWIGGKFGGVNLLNCSTYEWETKQLSEDGKVGNVVHFTHAADSGIWIIPHYGNVIYYNKRTKTFKSLPEMGIKDPKNKKWCAFDDSKGHLYIGHEQNGMNIVNLKDKTIRTFKNDPANPRSLPGNNIHSIFKDSMGNIWVGTNYGLTLFDPRTGEFTTFKHEHDNPSSLAGDYIYEIKELNDGMLWITSDIGGISTLDLHSITFNDPANIRFYNITADNGEHGVSSRNIRSLLQDSFGNIWIGNYSNGIDFISHTPPLFSVLPYMSDMKNILKYKPVWGLCKDKNGEVWLGGENEIILFRNNKPVKSIDITKHLLKPYGQVFSIVADSCDALLLGMYNNGLLKLDTRNNHIERIPLEVADENIMTFFKDTDRRIWIGAQYGVYSYFNGILRRENALNNQLPDRSVYGILRDRQGKLWVGSYGGGIIIFDRNYKAIDKLNTDKHFCSNAVNSFYMDRKGGIWVATRNGIGYIKDTNRPQEFETYGYEQGLEDTFVRTIQEDKSGNIWLSTNNGISYWNKEQQKFDNYDYRDGVPMGNFIEGSACLAEDGTLYFGSLNGVCHFNPERLIAERQTASVKIIECTRIDKQMENHKEEIIVPTSNGSIELPYNQNSFRISFSIPDYSQSNQVEYAYLIEGLTNTWTNTSGENQVTFRNIAPGDYTFKVKVRLRNQEWDNNHIATMKVRIHPPLWLTWYAKTFYTLFALSVVILILRFYKRKLKLESSLELERKKNWNEQELNNERLRFYTNITHELRTPLTLILGPLEDLINDPGLPPFYGNKINVIHANALRLLNLINQILEFRKTETQNRKLTVAKGNLSGLVTEIGLRYKELNRNEKVQLHIDVDTEEMKLYFDADILSTILNNLLSNALKYTPEGKIILAMHYVIEGGNRYAEITVSDTGYGIDEQALPHIFDRYYQVKGKHQASGTGIGLALVKSLSDLHEGTLHVESEVNKGTVFTFRLLTENTYPDALHKEETLEVIQENREKTEEEKEETDNSLMILIVEDNDDIREYIATSFSSNYRIITATNGKKGVEQAQKYIPDIIISDIMMPVMDGIELCKLVKEDIRTSHIPVILLTAKDSIQDKEKGYESGADSYLTKPFSAKLLNSRVYNLLESRKKLASLIANRTKDLKCQEVQTSMKLSKLDEEFLTKFTSIVEENIEMEKLDMTFMTDKMNMSHSTLYRKIKAVTGMSSNEFIRKIRLRNSFLLLTEKEFNISEAAYASGFNDIGYFRSCFKEEYGMTPSEYMKQQ